MPAAPASAAAPSSSSSASSSSASSAPAPLSALLKPDVQKSIVDNINGFLGDGNPLQAIAERWDSPEYDCQGYCALTCDEVIGLAHKDNGRGSVLHPLTTLHVSDDDIDKAPHLTIQGDWLLAILATGLALSRPQKLYEAATTCSRSTGLVQVTQGLKKLFGESLPGNIHFRLDNESTRANFPTPLTEKALDTQKAQAAVLAATQSSGKSNKPAAASSGSGHGKPGSHRQIAANKAAKGGVGASSSASSSASVEKITLLHAWNEIQAHLQMAPQWQQGLIGTILEKDQAFVKKILKIEDQAILAQYSITNSAEVPAWLTLSRALKQYSQTASVSTLARRIVK